MRRLLYVFVYLVGCFQSCDFKSKKLKEHFTEKMYLDAVLLINNGGVQKASKYVDSIFRSFDHISVKDKYRYYQFKVKTFVGIYTNQLDYKKAQLYADSMAYIIESNNLKAEMAKEYAEVFNLKSIYYIDEGENEKALDEAIKARSHIEQTKDSCGMSNYLANEGQIYFRMEKYEQAKASFLKEFDLMRHCPQDINYFYKHQLVLGNIGLCYRNLNDFKNTLLYNQKREKFILQNKNLIANNLEFVDIALADVFRMSSLSYFHEKNYPKALEFVKKAEVHNAKIKQSGDDVHWYKLYTIGINVALGELNTATLLLNKIENDAKKFNPPNLKSYYKVKYQIAAKTNNFKEEAIYTKKYFELTDSLNNVFNKQAKLNPDLKFDEMKNQLNVELLKKENELKQLYLSIFFGLLVVSLVFLYFNKKNLNKKNKLYERIKKLNEHLSENEKKLKQLNFDLEQSKEKQKLEALQLQQIKLELLYKNELLTEKQKISNELHDGISGTLAALKYYLSDPKIKNTINSNVIDEIENEIIYIYDNLRNFLLKLQSDQNQSDFDLFKFLRQISNKFNKGSLLKIELNYNEEKLLKILSDFEIIQLSLIINEAVTNVIKHSNASLLVVSINIENDICKFSVTDNGTGFDFKKVKNGLGLKSIRKRIKELAGNLVINSKPYIRTEISGNFKLIA